MMIDSLLDDIKAQNLVIYLKDGKVKLRGNIKGLSDNFLSELKARKSEILEHLSNSEIKTRNPQLESKGAESATLRGLEMLPKPMEDEAIILAEREAIETINAESALKLFSIIADSAPTSKAELSWFDLCAVCKSVLYTKRNQWFCPTNCR